MVCVPEGVCACLCACECICACVFEWIHVYVYPHVRLETPERERGDASLEAVPARIFTNEGFLQG